VAKCKIPSGARVLAYIGIMTAVISIPVSAQDGKDSDMRDGRLLAAACAACHGTDGQSQEVMPKLAGMQRDYLVEQMQAFRSGTRKATVMHQLSRGYSEQQIRLLADYFASRE
jgi:sulfide dehydrogenase cytochrome subunit